MLLVMITDNRVKCHRQQASEKGGITPNSLVLLSQTWDWGKVKKEENDAGVWGPQ